MTKKVRARGAAYFALFLLMLTYLVSYVDRMALGVLQEQIKRELGLSDWQLGLLSGPSFALLYSIMGLPIARLAERRSRSVILAASLTVWSLMTMLCGVARGYGQLLLARAGVSVGEAGCNPAAHSLIADLFPPQERGRAIAFYSLGAPAGAFVGALVAGWLAYHWGWRTTFLLLGPPGLLLALAVTLLVSDPPRGQFDRANSMGDVTPSFTAAVRAFFGNAILRHLAAGSAMIVLVGYGVSSFLPSFLVRKHGLDLETVGLLAGVVNGAGAAFGTVASGFAADRFGQRYPGLYARLPALMVALALPCFVLGFLSPSLAPSVVLLTVATFAIYTYIAPVFAQLHALLEPRMRATGASIMYLVLNLIGLGIGPPLIGLLSDYMTKRALDGAAQGGALNCSSPTTTDLLCRQAFGEGIAHALVAISFILIVAVAHFLRAGRLLDGKVERKV
jgi:predicted MFS family arabinose efflux permease